MPVRPDEKAARSERAQAIGLFRYQLIREAADPELSMRARGRMVREIASREHTAPDGRRVRVSRDTLDRWIAVLAAVGMVGSGPARRKSGPAGPSSPSLMV